MSHPEWKAPSGSVQPRGPARIEGGFPLAAVVLLVTTVAALLACVDMPLVRRELDTIDVQSSHVVGVGLVALTGAIVGGVLGFARPRRIRDMLFGAGMGSVTAVLLLPLILAPANLWQCLSAMAVLVVASIVVRLHAR